ncbi:helix-turn-helix domain-containing protein [Nocardia pseudobrasiliensis]|uniref:AraC-like DNA-binding protein n=1 Tax=Nocardia pseudobrasiliensis TaxID=45979 RepID=A0A370HS28_9NOCA|nr:helix-turn-helix domain-containing protein [Nocardia pseudobrasiliensis]RDI61336.1 AraC-like DNA-binding protein [Nocardia pseudobrasiliensis]
MAVLLDTDTLDPGDRADAVVAAVEQASAPAYVTHKPCLGGIHARLDGWQFGRLGLVRARISDLQLVRTPRLVRVSPSPLLAVEVQQYTCSRLMQDGTEHELVPGDLFFMDFDLPYELDWQGGGVTTLFIAEDALGLPSETIRAGLGGPRRSALGPLVANHIVRLGDCAEALQADPAAPELGDASVELVRALLRSAAGGSEDGTAVPEDILVTQVRDYVLRHLLDADLNPAGIARAHHISVRYLYKACARAEFSLEQWIIAQRLERARDILARPESRYRSIAAIAHGHGFRDATHFARRFRAAYGMTPSQWRQAAGERPAPGSLPAPHQPPRGTPPIARHRERRRADVPRTFEGGSGLPPIFEPRRPTSHGSAAPRPPGPRTHTSG